MNRITRTSTGLVRAAAAAATVVFCVALAPQAAAAGRAAGRDVLGPYQDWEASVPEVRAAARALEAAEGELEAARQEAAAAEAARDDALARVEKARAEVDEIEARQVWALAEAHVAQVRQQSAAAALEGAQEAARSRSGEFSLAGTAAGGQGPREEARIRTTHGRAQLDVVADWLEGETAEYEALRGELTRVTEQRNGARHELAAAERALAESVDAIADTLAAVEPAAAAVEQQREAFEERQAQHDRALGDLRGLGWRAGVLGRGGLVWPTDGKPGSRFGPRRHPITGTLRLHAGVDVPAPTGQNVVATRAGTVTFAAARGGYGFMVDLDHGDGRMSRYAHLSYIHVRPGDRVGQGQRIGRVGSTGASTGPHLHFEYQVNGKPQDPLRWFAGVVGG